MLRSKAHLDAWEKDVAPSDELRQWYEHDPAKWPEFRKRYGRELKAPAAKAVLDDLVRRAKRARVTLVYSSHAAAISDVAVLEKLLSRRVKNMRATKMARGAPRKHKPFSKSSRRANG